MARLHINYGINRAIRRKGRRGIEHSQGKMAIVGNWDDDATHEKIFAIIRRRHPGWLVTGYCKAT